MPLVLQTRGLGSTPPPPRLASTSTSCRAYSGTRAGLPPSILIQQVMGGPKNLHFHQGPG